MPKRPDQHRIAPEEAGATDYKNRPLESEGLERKRHAHGREAEREGADERERATGLTLEEIERGRGRNFETD